MCIFTYKRNLLGIIYQGIGDKVLVVWIWCLRCWCHAWKRNYLI